MANTPTPDDLILPNPETQKEMDLFNALADYATNVNSSFEQVNTLDPDKVKASSTDSTANYLDGSVDGLSIEVSADKLRVMTDGISSNNIADDAVTSSHILADAITSSHIATDAVTTNSIVIDAITSTHIQVDAITESHIAVDAITSNNVQVDAITSAHLVDDLVFGTFPLTPSAAPDADYEVANKKYVDDNGGTAPTMSGADMAEEGDTAGAGAGVYLPIKSDAETMVFTRWADITTLFVSWEGKKGGNVNDNTWERVDVGSGAVTGTPQKIAADLGYDIYTDSLDISGLTLNTAYAFTIDASESEPGGITAYAKNVQWCAY